MSRSRKKHSVPDLPWIEVAPGAPYFQTEHGESWTPVGQNDCITWPDLEGLFRRRDLASVDRYLAELAAHGVTCLRLMMEYAEGRHRFLERPAGTFVRSMVRLWDDLFALCACNGLRILLTPFDTYWMWYRWNLHPYNKANGGPCSANSQLLVCPETRSAMRRRLRFAVERWGGSGVLFAWDLWNEIHPAFGGGDRSCFPEFVQDLSETVRQREIELYGRSHPQTVSIFGPAMIKYATEESILRHPRLDFASTHLYEQGTIDHPRNTVEPAVGAGRLTREALGDVPAGRPYFDSEHGPIHNYIDHHQMLPEAFDDEYFRHIQWAHLASGGTGGGMRWPYRTPHCLTPGMRKAQKALVGFLPLIDWLRFQRRNLNFEIKIVGRGCTGFACGNAEQAVLWILRVDSRDKEGMLQKDSEPVDVTVQVPGLSLGRYRVTRWDTLAGLPLGCAEIEQSHDGTLLVSLPSLRTDVAVALRRV
jgi:hypothetical protein